MCRQFDSGPGHSSRRHYAVVTDAERAWTNLGPTWRSTFELAWESFIAHSVPVGALIVNAEGVIVAEGRARSMETPRTPGQLAGATVAHAEINALGQLPVGPHPAHTVYTTLEPCVMCTGAMVLASIASVQYAGADALWSGLEHLPEINAFVARRWPTRSGPRRDEFGIVATLLPLLFYLERYPSGDTAASHERAAPQLLAFARELVASGEHRRWETLPLTEALELLWPRLAALARTR
jgi:tRNA(adenine34) deaminase